MQIGFSPCPNDTFIFYALVHKKIPTMGLSFEPVLADVEALNQMAFSGTLPITKLSYFAYMHVANHYQLLHSGSALGKGCGPLLVARKHINLAEDGYHNLRVAIPGKYTTANLLFSIAYPEAKNKTEMLFSEIEDAVASGQVDVGVIIHENRFTYQQKGLVCLCDLGAFWETTTKHPIPLGGIAIQRSQPQAIKQAVNTLVGQSVQWAFANPAQTMPYVRQYAQTMNDEVMKNHINLYVNNYTLNLGEDGQVAVHALMQKAVTNHLIPHLGNDIFV